MIDTPAGSLGHSRLAILDVAGGYQLKYHRAICRGEEAISDAEFVAESDRLAADWNYQLPNKEALYYYHILRQFYRDEWILPGMGHSRSL